MTPRILTSKSIITPDALATQPVSGNRLVDLRTLGFVPGISGGAGGYNASGDVLTETVDGVDLNAIWDEYQETLEYYNQRRQSLIDLLTFGVTEPIERVSIPGGEDDFERASEFGEPVGIKSNVAYQSLGYSFNWFDLAIRYTWMYLAEASQSQVDSLNNKALNADIRLQFRKLMETIFRNVNRSGEVDGQALTVYPFYNDDGWVPPRFKNNTFEGSHSHYLTSGAATLDSGDLDAMITHLRHHGYGDTPGAAQILVLVNDAQAAPIRTFRTANGDSYDFVPPQGTTFPSWIAPSDPQVEGSQPPAEIQGIEVVGQYGPAIVLQESWMPAGYLFATATGGTANPENPVGIREHRNAGLRGLRLVKGRDADYPLIDSFYQRGFGTGVRHRGNGVVMEVTSDADYSVPTEYETPA